MSDEIEYRSLRPSDYDDIIRIWQEAGLSFRLKGRDSRKMMTAGIRRTPELYLGAFSENQLIGTVIGSFDGRRGCVNRLAVKPSYRKQGIAEKLVAMCEERLKAAGALVTFCLIDRDNDPSINLFTKLGYHFHKDILYFSKRDSAES